MGSETIDFSMLPSLPPQRYGSPSNKINHYIRYLEHEPGTSHSLYFVK